MPRPYPPEFRARVIALIDGGRSVAEIAAALEISRQTVYNWRRQDRMDRGAEPDLTSIERAELMAARRRIHELETELAAHRRASELLSSAPTE